MEAGSIKPEQVINEKEKKVLKASTFLLQVFHTVSPALAFQYVSLQPPDLEGRVPPYTDNLNSWLGQILQVIWTNKQWQRKFDIFCMKTAVRGTLIKS